MRALQSVNPSGLGTRNLVDVAVVRELANELFGPGVTMVKARKCLRHMVAQTAEKEHVPLLGGFDRAALVGIRTWPSNSGGWRGTASRRFTFGPWRGSSQESREPLEPPTFGCLRSSR